MIKNKTNAFVLCATALPMLGFAQQNQNKRPNVILIVADDLGFGDVSAYGSKTISTPHIDALAHQGVCFQNGYATSATSTPSRYAMFTGLYPWKNKDAKILPGDAPLLIPTNIPTLPKLMQQEGYKTAAIGKWHLGMGNGNVDWNQQISPCANDIGFDYSCLIAATNDRVPTVFVENGKVLGVKKEDPIQISYQHNFEGEETALTRPDWLRMEWSHGHNNSIINGIPRIGYMKGGENARWVDENMAFYFIDKVKNYIDEQKKSPFFLYYGLHQPHVPRTPNNMFVGKSGMGPRGDAILEADWCVGQLMDYLEKNHLLENTLVIFTSDNGPVLDDGYKDLAQEKLGNHSPMGGLRGGKYSLYDAGTHIPLFVYWKGQIKPTKSTALFSQLDFFASIANLIGASIPENIDSKPLTTVMMGTSNEGREDLIIEAQGRLAYHYKNYTFIPPYKGEVRNLTGNELGNVSEETLFDLSKDPDQKTNIANGNKDLVKQLKQKFLNITAGFYNPNVEAEELK